MQVLIYKGQRGWTRIHMCGTTAQRVQGHNDRKRHARRESWLHITQTRHQEGLPGRMAAARYRNRGRTRATAQSPRQSLPLGCRCVAADKVVLLIFRFPSRAELLELFYYVQASLQLERKRKPRNPPACEHSQALLSSRCQAGVTFRQISCHLMDITLSIKTKAES